jgi:hypothetical protein
VLAELTELGDEPEDPPLLEELVGEVVVGVEEELPHAATMIASTAAAAIARTRFERLVPH